MSAIAVFNDLSCGPIQGSTKVYRELPDGGKVPFRRVNLTTGEVKFDKNGDRMAAKMYVIAVKDSARSTAGTVNVIRK